MTNILSTKAVIHCVTLEIPKGMTKYNFYFCCSRAESLIKNESVASEAHKTKNRLKIFYM